MPEKKIIRSLISDPLYEPYVIENFSELQKTGLKIRDKHCLDVINYLEDFFVENGGFPQEVTVKEHFAKENNGKVAILLDEVMQESFFRRADFRSVVKDLHQKYLEQDCANALKESAEILRSGKKVGNDELKGGADCVKYLMEKVASLKVSLSTEKKQGDIREDAGKVKLEYLERKRNPSNSIGMLTKLDHLDEVTRGVHPGELMVVCAFVSQFKSTYTMNMAHYSVVNGYNIVFISLEMPYTQVKNIFYCIHSGSEVFAGVHPPLEYEKIKFGLLTPEEEDFFLNKVIPDFENNKSYGKLFVHQMDDDPTLPKIRSAAEMYNKEAFISAVYVDYLTLIKPTKSQSFGKKQDNVNQIVQDLKQVALGFDNNRSVAIISPTQINRDGWMEAGKKNGFYAINAIAEFNYIEKAADVIIGIYVNEDLKKMNEAVVTHMKGRDSRLAPMTNIYANGATRQISSLSTNTVGVSEKVTDIEF